MGLDPGFPGSRPGLQGALNRCATGVAPGPYFDLVTLVSTWASSGHVYSIPTGTHLNLVTLVLTLASSVPGDSGPTWASPGTGDSDPQQHASNAPFH